MSINSQGLNQARELMANKEKAFGYNMDKGSIEEFLFDAMDPKWFCDDIVQTIFHERSMG